MSQEINKKIRVLYRASENLRKALYLETGDCSRDREIFIDDDRLIEYAKIGYDCRFRRNGKDSVVFEIDLVNDYRDIPLWYVDTEIDEDANNEFGIKKYKAVVKKARRYDKPVFDRVPTADDILALFTEPDLSIELAEKRIELEREYYSRLDEERIKTENEKFKEEQRKKEEEKRLAELHKFRFEARQWISEHGSERLKMMLNLGFEFDETYENERLQKEFPGAEFIDEGMIIEAKKNPTLEQMKKLVEIREADNTSLSDIVETRHGTYVIFKPRWAMKMAGIKSS